MTLQEKLDYTHFKTLDERSKEVKRILDDNLDEYEYRVKITVHDERPFSKQILPNVLDNMGSYLLVSHDIESPRELPEYPFFVSESDFGRRELAKTTQIVDLQKNSWIVEGGKDFMSENGFEERVQYLVKKLNISTMTFNEKKKLVKRGLPEMYNPESNIQQEMYNMYLLICKNLINPTDKFMFDLLVQGNSYNDIAEKTGIPKRSVYRKIDKIIENIGVFEDIYDDLEVA